MELLVNSWVVGVDIMFIVCEFSMNLVVSISEVVLIIVCGMGRLYCLR